MTVNQLQQSLIDAINQGTAHPGAKVRLRVVWKRSHTVAAEATDIIPLDDYVLVIGEYLEDVE